MDLDMTQYKSVVGRNPESHRIVDVHAHGKHVIGHARLDMHMCACEV